MATLNRLLLDISGKVYSLTPLDSPDGPAWSVARGSDAYHVRRTPHGPECDCPDWIMRREHRGPAGCKHVRALREFRLP